jgi:hypothetical protein
MQTAEFAAAFCLALVWNSFFPPTLFAWLGWPVNLNFLGLNRVTYQ